MTLNLKELEKEALEVNSWYNSYRMHLNKHRKKMIEILNEQDGEGPVKELVRILMITNSREE